MLSILSRPIERIKARQHHPAGLTCDISNPPNLGVFERADYLTDLVQQKLLALRPEAINTAFLETFSARSISFKGFAQGISRTEDKFLLDGLKPYLAKAINGEKIRVREEGAGTSYPVTNERAANNGLPWLSRMIAATVWHATTNLKISLANHSGDSKSLVIRDRNGHLHFQGLYYDLLADEIAETPLGQAVPVKQVIQQLNSSLTRSFQRMIERSGIDFTDADVFIRPRLDPEYEGSWQLAVADANDMDYQSCSTSPTLESKKQNYDYIFARHLNQEEYPNEWSIHATDRTIEATRTRLAPNGEARLVFDHPFLPKKALIITHDTIAFQHIL